MVQGSAKARSPVSMQDIHRYVKGSLSALNPPSVVCCTSVPAFFDCNLPVHVAQNILSQGSLETATCFSHGHHINCIRYHLVGHELIRETLKASLLILSLPTFNGTETPAT